MIAYAKIDGKLAAFDGGDGEYDVDQIIDWVKHEHKVERCLVLMDSKRVVTEPEAA